MIGEVMEMAFKIGRGKIYYQDGVDFNESIVLFSFLSEYTIQIWELNINSKTWNNLSNISRQIALYNSLNGFQSKLTWDGTHAYTFWTEYVNYGNNQSSSEIFMWKTDLNNSNLVKQVTYSDSISEDKIITPEFPLFYFFINIVIFYGLIIGGLILVIYIFYRKMRK